VTLILKSIQIKGINYAKSAYAGIAPESYPKDIKIARIIKIAL
jgi:hypothetical protein